MSNWSAPSRCDQCGASRYQCSAECIEEDEAVILDVMGEHGFVTLIEFGGDLETQRMLLSRVTAKWPGVTKVIEPTQSGGCYSVRCAADEEWLDGEPDVSFRMTMGGLEKLQTVHDLFE